MRQQRPYKRTERVSQQIREILAETQNRHIDLSHLGLITFTRVNVTPDLRIAKIYYTVVNPSTTRENIQKNMKNQAAHFRKFLGNELHIKFTPELRFYYDDTLDHSERIDSLLSKLDIPDSSDDL